MLSRAELATAVSGELAGVLTLARFTATDSSGNMKEVLDRTFRALGVAEGGLATASVADGNEERAIAYLRYFVIDKAVYATTAKMNLKAGSSSANLREQHENLLRLLASALAVAQSFGLPLPGNGLSGVMPIPYAGGISEGDYVSLAHDGDRLPPLFSLQDLVRAEAW